MQTSGFVRIIHGSPPRIAPMLTRGTTVPPGDS